MIADVSASQLLILAPIGRDAELMRTYLQRDGMTCMVAADIDALCAGIDDGAGAILVTDEALGRQAVSKLLTILTRQPAWSEIPIIIFTGLPSLEAKTRSFHELGQRTNITLIDRPVRIASLVSAARSALRARQRQYEIRDLMNKLEDRVHERDRFLAILGHELRNPLGAILLASQMRDDDGRLDADHGQLIERQARHLTRLVNDLLDLSRVVSGKIALKAQSCDLRQIVGQSLQTLSEFARGHQVAVEVRQPDEPLPAFADPVRADQIISNILSNALKYTLDGGHVVVSLERDGTQAVIRVSDDGLGIAPERIGNIFELFAQAENAIGRAQGGMGIGLALVRNLVELHGGTVTAHSEGVGKGSEFVIRLPLTDQALAPEAASPPPISNAEARQRRIVIVEDNPDVRELLGLKLRRLGHSVDAIGDGAKGIQAILRVRPDMALIDIGLPGLDGYEIARQVRSEIGGNVVLVAVSGFGQPEDKRKAIEAGFDDHLTKPADVRDIEDLLVRFPPRTELPEVAI